MHEISFPQNNCISEGHLTLQFVLYNNKRLYMFVHKDYIFIPIHLRQIKCAMLLYFNKIE